MRAFLTAVTLLVSLSSAAIAGPKEDALQVLEKWAKAFNDSGVDAIVKLHAPDAMFMGTASKTVVVNSQGIRAYFENALLNDRPRTAKLNDYTAVVLSDAAVAVSGLDTLTGVRDGKTYVNPPNRKRRMAGRASALALCLRPCLPHAGRLS